VLGRLQNNNYVSRTEAEKAFENLRMQAANLPEMSLEEINAEISEARAERNSMY
jgi:hypothetical protein